MKRRYVVHVGSRYSDTVIAGDARAAARFESERSTWRGYGGTSVTKVVVDATGEVVPEELWR